jgi:hypothetical protein
LFVCQIAGAALQPIAALVVATNRGDGPHSGPLDVGFTLMPSAPKLVSLKGPRH